MNRERGKDFYAALGLRRGASESDVRKAYRKLAMRWHPVRARARDARRSNRRGVDARTKRERNATRATRLEKRERARGDGETRATIAR